MTYLLSKADYTKISKHYDMKETNKDKIEGALARKMCRCIKKVSKTYKQGENAAIAICNKSIFRNRGLKFNKVTCKKRANFIKNKGKGWKLAKTSRNLKFKNNK
jgi:hypothetical protein